MGIQNKVTYRVKYKNTIHLDEKYSTLPYYLDIDKRVENKIRVRAYDQVPDLDGSGCYFWIQLSESQRKNWLATF